MIGDRKWIYDDLAKELFMSKSSIHAGLKRAEAARLINLKVSKQPYRQALLL